MGIAEALAAISAAMQAFDLYAKYGGSREQIIQTLNLEYNPSHFQNDEKMILGKSAQQQIQTTGAGDQIVLNTRFAETYIALFAATGTRVQQCVEGFTKAIKDDQLPFEREKLSASAKSCVCKEILMIWDFMGYLPSELAAVWQQHGCAELFKKQ